MKKVNIISMKQISNRDGFTLIEVLVALVLLMTGLLGVAGMQIMAISGNAFGQKINIATKIGQDFLERMKTVKFKNCTNVDCANDQIIGNALAGGAGPNGLLHQAADGDCPDVLYHPVSPDNVIGFGGLTFTRTWRVIDHSPVQNCKTIIVEVSWLDKYGNNHRVTLQDIKWVDGSTI